jgi:methionyl-tRNA formyltransferase
MRIGFFGIYSFGVRALNTLLATHHAITWIVTKPSSAGDAQPVAAFASTYGPPVLQPRARELSDIAPTLAIAKPDLIVVAGYHQIIPDSILMIPPRGAINVHGSLLPAYRGPCPWKHQIARGERSGGVTIHYMTSELDKGPIVSQRPVRITDDDTGGSLYEKVAQASAELLADTLPALEQGNARAEWPDETSTSYFGYPTELDAQIPWDASAVRIRNIIRGMFPRPRAWTRFGDTRIVIGGSSLVGSRSTLPPGTVVSVASDSWIVATGTEDIAILDLQWDRHVNIKPRDRFAAPHLAVSGSGLLS